MARTRTAIWITLLAVVVLAMTVGLACTASPSVLADGEVLTMDATLYWYRDGADNAIISPRLWTRGAADQEWTIVEQLSDVGAYLRYVSLGGGITTTAPTEVGKYTVQIVLDESADSYRSVTGANLNPGSVVFEREYRIMPSQLAIVFAPQNNVIQGQFTYERILDETIVMASGQPLDLGVDYSIQVSKEGVAVTSIADAGTYTVTVTLLAAVGDNPAGSDFSAVVVVKTNLDNLIAVDNTVRYEGMFSDTSSAASVAYYTPVLSGTLVDSYSGSYSVTYLTSQGKVLPSAPTKAGTYTVRVALTQAIDALDLAVGDYVDCFYSVKAMPYSVTFRVGGEQHLGSSKFDLYYSPMGLGVNTPVVDNGSDTLDAGYLSTKYYQWHDQHLAWEEMPLSALGEKGNVISSIGYYKVVFALDYTADGGTELSGNAWFPGANGFAISQNNNLLTCYFEVKGNYTVSGFSSTYAYTGEALSSAQLNPVIMSQGSSARGHFDVAYYHEGVLVSRDQVGVLSGRYEAIVTFGDWVLDGETPVAVTSAGETYHFSFDVEPVPFTIRVEDSFNHEDKEAELLSSLGLANLNNVRLTYLSFHDDDGYYDVVSHDAFFTQVGFYRLDVKVGEGRYKGFVFSYDFVNRAASSLSQITVSFDNTPNTIIPYTGMPVVADFDFGEMPVDTKYSILYEEETEEFGWVYCDYPILPGSYRVRVHFNEACPYFDVEAGAERSVKFTIKPLTFSVEFEVVSGDNVYDGHAKEYDPTYYADGRPMMDAEIEMMGITIRYARSTANQEDMVFLPDAKPVEAGDYYFAVLFNDDMRMFGLTQYTGSEYTLAELIGHAAFSRRITVDKLQLAAVVELPYGYGGLYTQGSNLVPSYTFYKYNGSTTADPAVMATLPEIDWVNATYYDVAYRRGELNGTGFGNTWIDPSLAGTLPSETGNYQYVISIHAEHSGNLYVAKVASPQAGEGLAVDLDAEGGKYSFARPAVSAVYRINPRPISVVAPAYQGNIYYGQAASIEVSDLAWTTLGANGQSVPFSDADMSSFVSLAYYERSGDSIVMDGDLFDESGRFVSGGEYTLRITFDTPIGEEENLLYSRYTLTNGYDREDLELASFLQAGCYTDMAFRVRSAEAIRVVFAPQFNSYAYDGEPKGFDVRFVTQGEVDVTAELAGAYNVVYKNLLSGIDLAPSVKPTATGSYSIRVEFGQDIYRYRVVQRQGVYQGYGEDRPYVVDGGMVTFEFDVTQPALLAWEWINPQGEIEAAANANLTDYDRYAFDGQSKGYSVRFFVNDERRVNVNLMLHTDYEINYYVRLESGRYQLLSSAPTEVGEYLAEIIFLAALDDYRVGDAGATRIVTCDYANANDGYFGRSLVAAGGELTNNLAEERRYLQVAVDKAHVLIAGLSVEDKVFDNTANAVITGKAVPTAETGALTDQARADFAAVIRAVNACTFDSVGVGEQSVTFDITVGEAVIPVPHARLTSSGVAFLTSALATASETPDWKEALDRLALSYDFLWEDVSGVITKKVIAVLANDYTRTYDPYFVDGDFLTYRVSQANLAFLLSLNVDGLNDPDLSDFFTGHLERADSDNFNVNEEGYDIGFSEDWGWIDNPLTLSDGTITTLSAQLDNSITDAKYYILRKEITIGTDGDAFRYYDQEDGIIPVVVVEGKLLAGDRISAEGEYAAVRASFRDRDDIGRYSIDFSAVRIFNGLSDRTDNYRISYQEAFYTILPRTVTIRPDIETNLDRQNYTVADWQAFAPTPLVKIYNDGAAEIDFDLSSIGASVLGNFTLTPRAVTSERIYRSFSVGSGQLRLVDADGRDITDNFNVLPLTNCVYNVRKYSVRLAVDDSEYEKTYGSPDPKMSLSELGSTLRSLGFRLSEDSTASRESGEDVLFDEFGNVLGYNILSTNEGTIHILNSEGEDVTAYCYVEVENSSYESMTLKQYKLIVKPLPVTVTVREEAINRTGRAIIPSIVFYDASGNAVSTAITSTMRARFGMAEDQVIVEGDNVITPVLLTATDPNFIFTMVPGTLHVVYPENHVSISIIDVEDELTESNSYAFVGGKLFKTLQLYKASTDNGKDPTKSVQTILPTTDATVNRDVYVVAVRRDGSFVLLDAQMAEDGLLISDTQFNYIMVAELQVWPYYLIAGVVVLAAVAVLAIALRSKRRQQVRGKKEKAPKPAKEKAPKPVKEKQPKPAKEKEPKPAKEPKAPKHGKEEAAPQEENTLSYAPVRPKSEPAEDSFVQPVKPLEEQAPVETLAQPEENVAPIQEQPKEAPIQEQEEEIVIATSKRFDDEPALVSPHEETLVTPQSSDDEIVVSSSRRRFDDEE